MLRRWQSKSPPASTEPVTSASTRVAGFEPMDAYDIMRRYQFDDLEAARTFYEHHNAIIATERMKRLTVYEAPTYWDLCNAYFNEWECEVYDAEIRKRKQATIADAITAIVDGEEA